MDPRPAGDITILLSAASSGDENASAALAERVYDELKRIARKRMRHERPGHTLQPTALVNEAFVKLLGGAHRSWQGRGHFFAAAGRLMHRILIDHSRAGRAQKRGGQFARKVTLDANVPDNSVSSDQVLAVRQALARLRQLDPRQCLVVELRLFNGLTEQQVAHALGMSERTVKRDWNMALAYLHGEMTRPAGG
jgi:RNA polymerase sigma factor (TIGR02999 family)